MTSRERVRKALGHEKPDRVPVDFGGTVVTGIGAGTLYRLRAALKLEKRDVAIEDFKQMLGRVEEDLRQAMGSDVIGLYNPVSSIGVRDGSLMRFVMPDGTPTLISEHNKYFIDEDGYICFYPQGDDTVAPSVRMPSNGHFFDNIDRSGAFDEDNLTPVEDFKNAFGILRDEDARYFENKAKELYENTDYAIVGNLGGGALGSAGLMPGPAEKHPRGIRRTEDWLMAHVLYPEYIEEVFRLQTDIMLKNLEIYRQAVGDKICALFISGTDFGTQNGLFFSAGIFRRLYKPFFKEINDWIHGHTTWKTFYHSCGSNYEILDDFVEMGVDIFNPVQISAKEMDGERLKEKYGEQLVFWGGGIDTQKTLPHGTPEEVYRETIRNLNTFSGNGGYVFNTVHNIVANTPIENIMAMLQAIGDFNAKDQCE